MRRWIWITAAEEMELNFDTWSSKKLRDTDTTDHNLFANYLEKEYNSAKEVITTEGMQHAKNYYKGLW